MYDPVSEQQSAKVKFWPSPQDYSEAMQSPQTSFSSAVLQSAHVELNALGLPRPISGGFASVYRLRSDKADVAVRCFLTNRPELHERYKKISEFIQTDDLPYTVDFEYIEQGVRVSGVWFPVLKMEWVSGDTLEQYVEKHAASKDKLVQLRDNFKTMCSKLRQSGIAHGDLQHGNIIVTESGELRLVDYDGMFVPSMQGWKSLELGHVNYQHPQRDASCFDHSLDNFSSLVIYTALGAISRSPQLIDQFGVSDSLLFRAHDLREPNRSALFRALDLGPDAEVRQLSHLLRKYLSESPSLTASVSELPDDLSAVCGPQEYAEVVGHSASLSLEARDQWWADQTPTVGVAAPAVANTEQLVGLGDSGAQVIELTSPLPRAVGYNFSQQRVNPWRKQLLVLPLLIFCLSIAAYYATVVSLNATVTRIQMHGAAAGPKYAAVDYEYVLGKRTHFDGHQEIRKDDPLLESVQKSRTIEVYDSWLVPGHMKSLERWAIFAVLGFFASAALTVSIWLEPFRHRHLAQSGQAVTGLVSHRFKSLDPQVPGYRIAYTYEAAGILRKGLMEVALDDFVKVRPNTSVTVLYDPEFPDNSCLYALAYFKARS